MEGAKSAAISFPSLNLPRSDLSRLGQPRSSSGGDRSERWQLLVSSVVEGAAPSAPGLPDHPSPAMTVHQRHGRGAVSSGNKKTLTQRAQRTPKFAEGGDNFCF